MQHSSDRPDRVVDHKTDARTQGIRCEHLPRCVAGSAVSHAYYDLRHLPSRISDFRYTAGRTYSRE